MFLGNVGDLMETCCVLFDVRNEFFNIVCVGFMLQRIKKLYSAETNGMKYSMNFNLHLSYS
jgi:hypothetical protein